MIMYRRREIRFFPPFLSALFLLLLVADAMGSPQIGVVTWDSGSDTLGWESRDGVATLVAVQASGGHPDGYLQMHFAVPDYPEMEHDFLVNNGLDYQGDYTGLTLTFDFLGYPSSALSLYFQSSANGGSTWVNDFVVTSTDWESLQYDFGNASGWRRILGSGSFSTALMLVSEIGISVQHLNDGMVFDYGIDNWALSNAGAVPEPDSILMFFAVLISILVTFRQQVRATIVRLRSSGRPQASR